LHHCALTYTGQYNTQQRVEVHQVRRERVLSADEKTRHIETSVRALVCSLVRIRTDDYSGKYIFTIEVRQCCCMGSIFQSRVCCGCFIKYSCPYYQSSPRCYDPSTQWCHRTCPPPSVDVSFRNRGSSGQYILCLYQNGFQISEYERFVTNNGRDNVVSIMFDVLTKDLLTADFLGDVFSLKLELPFVNSRMSCATTRCQSSTRSV
jgi:hypothetical protein